MRAVFMGTPEFAAVILRHVLESGQCEVAGVYCQPDRPCGRGQKCVPLPVKKLALEQGLPIFQPENFKDPKAIEELAALEPDVLLVAAYGLILPNAVLEIPKYMPINVHASLLPKYRGAAPIQRAIMAGEQVTGVTIMRIEPAMDSGPILMQRALVIGQEDTAGTIHDELAELGGRLLVEAVDRLKDGRLLEIPQDHDKAVYSPKIEKREAEICWDRPAQVVHDQIRAMTPHPGAFFFWRPDLLKMPLRISALPGSIGEELPDDIRPGTILGVTKGCLGVACADRIYLIPRVRPAGKREQSAEAFACGYLNKCVDPELSVCTSDQIAGEVSKDSIPG